MTLKNTENNAIISIANTNSDIEPADIAGGFYKKDGHFYVTYTEGEKSGMGTSRVLLRVEENCITMRRMGEYSTVMRYIPGQETQLMYKTPYGEMQMKIKTHKIDNRLTDAGGELAWEYELFAGGDASKNKIILRVKLTEE